MGRYFDRENRGKWDWGGLEIKRKLNRRPSEKEAIEQRRLWDPERRQKILEWELARMHAKEAKEQDDGD